MHVAVVGHVEWVEFLRVPEMPAAGEIVHASERWEEPGGGGAVAAVQLALLAQEAAFFTALAGDELGRASQDELVASGVEVLAATRTGPSRRAITHVDARGERTITVLGERMVPRGEDPLPWYTLGGFAGVYFTGGDAAALRAARAAGCLVATARAGAVLAEADIELDVLVRSATDPGEMPPEGVRAAVVVATEGAAGGSWRRADGSSGRWKAAPLPGPVADAYGCGDAFAAGLTFALGSGASLDEALGLAARCGAAVLTGAGPYTGMLRREDPGASRAATA
jgi:ribokinase